MAALDIPVHVEVSSGLSAEAYRSLDVYVSTHTPGYDPIGAVRFRVSSAGAVWERKDCIARRWWELDVWQHMGQAADVKDWYVDATVPQAVLDHMEQYMAEIRAQRIVHSPL